MILIWTVIGVLQLVLALAGALSVWANRSLFKRLGGLAALVSLVPLMVLGGIWPSALTVVALLALPALVIWLWEVWAPGFLQRPVLRWYCLGTLVCGVGVSMLVAISQAQCLQLTFVVPDGFIGEVRLVKDSRSGRNLIPEGHTITVNFPLSGEVSISDDSFIYDCHYLTVLSESGKALSYRNKAMTFGSRGTEENAEFDGTTHRWVVGGSDDE